MAKDAFYFSHDYDPTGDPKIQAMIGEYGAAGYGLFWRIVEMLHAEENHQLPKKEYLFLAIAKQMLTNAEQVVMFIEDCTNRFELFISDGAFFWSNRVYQNIDKKNSISVKRSIAGKEGAIAKQVQAIAKQNEAKERKEKEKKRNKKIIKGDEINNPFSVDISSLWEEWKKYKKDEHSEYYKATSTEQTALNKLFTLSNGDFHTAEKIINQSISNQWKGLFNLNDHGQQSTTNGGLFAGQEKPGTSAARIQALKEWGADRISPTHGTDNFSPTD
jgi:hypothetical protein